MTKQSLLKKIATGRTVWYIPRNDESNMKQLSKIIAEIKFKDRPKNISKEFQIYGVYLAESLNDTKHYSLYIKLAKGVNRNILEEALNFTKGYYNAKNKARVFMWKLKELKAQKESV